MASLVSSRIFSYLECGEFMCLVRSVKDWLGPAAAARNHVMRRGANSANSAKKTKKANGANGGEPSGSGHPAVVNIDINLSIVLRVMHAIIVLLETSFSTERERILAKRQIHMRLMVGWALEDASPLGVLLETRHLGTAN